MAQTVWPQARRIVLREASIMFTRSRLACSFCGRDAAEVSKLVAGPRVFICDACVAKAGQIMSDPNAAEAAAPRRAASVWRRIGAWLGEWRRGRKSRETSGLTKGVASAI